MSKDNSHYHSVSGQASIFSQIFTFIILIIVLLLILLWVLNREKIDKLDLPPEKTAVLEPVLAEDKGNQELQKLQELIEDTNKIINKITETITIYSITEDQEALETFTRIIDKLTKHLKKNSIKDVQPVLDQLNKMADALMYFVDTHSLKDTKHARENLITKLEDLSNYLGNYIANTVMPTQQKLSDIIEKLRTKKEIEKPQTKENKEKPVKTETKEKPAPVIPHKTPQWQKPDYDYHVLEPESEAPLLPTGGKTTTDEIIQEKIEDKIEDKISGKTICLKPNDNQTSNSVHMMENQMLIKIISIKRGSASLDISHPVFGLRKFTDMEEGTRMPFEYGTKTYFCELIEIKDKKCANVAVYERNEIPGN
ncbi:Uncharacterized protein dnl_55240 [Desulfonema limicola]|uniref:Uncharacterized protein n=1 Tax=Desulfonema limicola TaxID=45656 RepID=A0A975GJ06_9BACT|nr:hypothetical protein [Desulfonema limicola]QTA83130.1 Uncharacterized protein dnl_55240 [Desulfonema limicola]